MPPFIPDVPYKIQFIFVLTFSYVWSTAFIDDYEAPLPADGPERSLILVRYYPYDDGYLIRDGTLCEQ